MKPENSYEMTRFDLLPDEIVEMIYFEKHKLEMKEVCEDINEFPVTLLTPPYDASKYGFRYKQMYHSQKLDLTRRIQNEFFRIYPYIDLNVVKKWSRVKLIINWCKVLELPDLDSDEELPVVFMDGARCRCCDRRVYIGDEQETINLKLVEDGKAKLGSCGKAICESCD